MISTFFLAIVVTSLATFLSRLLGVVTSQKILEDSKIFRWFNCIAYSTLAALISKVVIFPAGDLIEADIFLRLGVVILCVTAFYIFKKNLVYPTVLSAILLTVLIKFIQ